MFRTIHRLMDLGLLSDSDLRSDCTKEQVGLEQADPGTILLFPHPGRLQPGDWGALLSGIWGEAQHPKRDSTLFEDCCRLKSE